MAGSLRFRGPLIGTAEQDLAGPGRGTTSAVVVAVAILAGAGAVALSGGNSPTDRPTPGRVTVASVAPVLPATTHPVRAVPHIAAAEPLLVAPDVQWQLFAGVPLPYSKTAGPLQADGPVYSSYQRSQTGALIAAVQLGARYLVTPGDGWRQVVERQVLPGVGRDTFARNRATVTQDAPPGTYGQTAGFRFVAYTPDVAAIQLVSRFPTRGALQVITATVAWVDGDWRLALQPDGGSSATAQAVSSLDGFVVWGI